MSIFDQLTALQHTYYQNRDRRLVFLTAVLDQFTESPATYAYLEALSTYDEGNLPDGAWRIAFDAARYGESLVIQDLWLGLNAWGAPLPTSRTESRIEQLYAPAFSLLGRTFFPAVSGAKALDLTADPTSLKARLIVSAGPRRLLFDGLRKIEAVAPWWRYVTPGKVQERTPAPLQLKTLDELTAVLEEIARRYDARRSRLAIHAAALAILCTNLRDAGLHEILMHAGAGYLDALESFDAGSLDALGECWLIAFQSAILRDNLVLQDLMLGLNATFFSDAQTVAEPIRDEMIALENLVMSKYGEQLGMPKLLGAPLQGILTEFTFERRGISPELISYRMLLRGLPGATWVVLALKHVEDESTGPWTDWLRP